MDKRWTLRCSIHEDLLQRPYATLAALAVLVAALVVLLAPFASHPLFLPVLSFAAMAASGLAALLGWACRTQWRGDNVTIWDISGAFAFIGCAAAALSQRQLEHILQFLGLATVGQ